VIGHHGLPSVNMNGFIPLSPDFDFSIDCPACASEALGERFLITGMWTAAECRCKRCGLRFLHDLPYALGVLSPFWLDLHSEHTEQRYSGQWYADTTLFAYKNRIRREVNINVVKPPKTHSVCLVNCLHPWWGDAVNLALRLNHLADDDMEVLVLINPGLRHLVERRNVAIWEVEQGLADNAIWNDGLDTSLKRLAASSRLKLYLPKTFQPAYLTQPELASAIGYRPFPRNEWDERLESDPTVTFMWRLDRVWTGGTTGARIAEVISLKVRSRRPFQNLGDMLRCRAQLGNVIALAESLRDAFPKLRFNVCGLGKNGRLPPWIHDLRADSISEQTNRGWALAAAESHVLCGVTGSHLTIPGSLAGVYIELVPRNFLRNILTCAPVNTREPRETIVCHRLIPDSTDYSYLADLITSSMLNFSYNGLAFSDRYYPPLSALDHEKINHQLRKRCDSLRSVNPKWISRLAN
jgi:hypothetical protein